ncbi:MAG: TfoX/Sxy family protein [Nitrospiria bacterium]
MPAKTKSSGLEDSFKDFILDQLSDLGGVISRSMFGGVGLYFGDLFFGIIFNGRLYFKTDTTTRSDYMERDMRPFKPNPRQTLKSYYEVPAEIIEDQNQLDTWVRKGSKARSRKALPDPASAETQLLAVNGHP